MKPYCHCGNSMSFAQCCQPLIDGQKYAETAEQLMRSRYSAYATANIEYIQHTMRGNALAGFELEKTKIWAQHVKWLKLSVLKVEYFDKTHACVSFEADYLEESLWCQMQETSLFEHIQGQWYYVDNRHIDTKTRTVGSNQNCPCNSGKKFKRCCRKRPDASE